jgi:hypothetical protein|nr:MAG TPA: hypothetical protein [Caudoviricetes sp.]
MTEQTKKELTLNQIAMIEIAFGFEDYDLEKILEYQRLYLISQSTASDTVKDYVHGLYQRLRKEAKGLLDCVTFEEVYVRSSRMFKTHEALTEMSQLIWKEVEITEEMKDEMAKANAVFKPLYEAKKQEVKEVLDFYRSLD